jgi:hypothetical protein
VFSIDRSADEFNACVKLGVLWENAWPARARMESCLKNMMLVVEGGWSRNFLRINVEDG